jgi:hypothetical protein
VLFFGDEGERGWIPESSAFAYAGRVAFDRQCQSSSVQSNVRERKNYVIPPNRRRAWEIAVASAEHAWMLSHEQRIAEFLPPSSVPVISNATVEETLSCHFNGNSSEKLAVSNLNMPETESAAQARLATSCKRVGTGSNGTDAETPSPIKQARLSTGESDQMSPTSPGCSLAAAQFAIFCQSRRQVLNSDLPDHSAEEIDRLLREEWSQMDSTAHQKYVPSMSDAVESMLHATVSSNEG